MPTITEFKEKYSDIYQAVIKEGSDEGYARGLEDGLEGGRREGREDGILEGAAAERERIRAVEAQLIPGHENLIENLKYDGETTGEQAAVKVLQAEKSLREDVGKQLSEDAPDAVAHVATAEVEQPTPAEDTDAPMDDRARATWEKDSKLRSEFGSDFDAYLAFRKADAAGQVRIQSKK